MCGFADVFFFILFDIFFLFHYSITGLLVIVHSYFFYLFHIGLSRSHDMNREFGMIIWLTRVAFIIFFSFYVFKC